MPHFSVNLIPRFENDNLLEWERKKVNQEELEKLASEMRNLASHSLSGKHEQARVEEKPEEKKEPKRELSRFKRRIP